MKKNFLAIATIALIGIAGYFVWGKKSQVSTTVSCIGDTPVILSLSKDTAVVGNTVTLYGCNLRGFEGDKNVWITNSAGEKGIIYGARDESTNTLTFTVPTKACTVDESYKGEPCPKFISLSPGTYNLYVNPLSTKSNEVDIMITGELSSVSIPGWKTYEGITAYGDQYKYSISYPSNWKLQLDNVYYSQPKLLNGRCWIVLGEGGKSIDFLTETSNKDIKIGTVTGTETIYVYKNPNTTNNGIVVIAQ